jgi:hypothetical protein
MLFENSVEMQDVIFSNVFDSKVVNDEREIYGVPFVFLIAWCKFALCVACLLELFFEEFLCNDACLRESVHSLLYLTVHVSIVIDLAC